jgi:DNA polymerase
MLVVPFYHPAAALHRPSLRPVVEEDFAKLPELIQNAEAAPIFEKEEIVDKDDQAEQLSMF